MGNDLARDLGTRIRELRIKRNMTQEDIADGTGSSQSHIGRIERGEINIGLDLLEKVAAVLNVQPGQLFALNHEKEAQILRDELDGLLDKASEQDIRLIFRIVDSIIN